MSAQTARSVDPSEIEKFSRMAAEWWDPTGKFAPLHKFNPVRLKFIRETVAAQFERNGTSLRPFEELSLLDIGCGGGLLSEPMSRLGFAVTGVDPSEKNIGTARAHAAQSGAKVDYRASDAEALVAQGQTFDVVLNMEVVEHVADLRGYLESTAALVKPGGLMFVATLNRTLKALALAKVGAEYLLRWVPAGTHDWNKFLKPEEIRAFMAGTGFSVLGPFGVAYNPLTGRWAQSPDSDVNYMMTVTRDLTQSPAD